MGLAGRGFSALWKACLTAGLKADPLNAKLIPTARTPFVFHTNHPCFHQTTFVFCEITPGLRALPAHGLSPPRSTPDATPPRADPTLAHPHHACSSSGGLRPVHPERHEHFVKNPLFHCPLWAWGYAFPPSHSYQIKSTNPLLSLCILTRSPQHLTQF